MRIVTFELPGNNGQVAVNAELVRSAKRSEPYHDKPASKLIFDESDHFDVLGDIADVSEILGLSHDD